MFLLRNLFFESSGPRPRALGLVMRDRQDGLVVKPMGSGIRLSQSDEDLTFSCLSVLICQMGFTAVGLIS